MMDAEVDEQVGLKYFNYYGNVLLQKGLGIQNAVVYLRSIQKIYSKSQAKVKTQVGSPHKDKVQGTCKNKVIQRIKKSAILANDFGLAAIVCIDSDMAAMLWLWRRNRTGRYIMHGASNHQNWACW